MANVVLSQEELQEQARQIRDADEKKFASRFEQERDWLVVYVRRKLTGVDAEDLVQDIYCTAWLKRTEFEGRSPFGTYLLGIANNLILHEIRNKGRSMQAGLAKIFYKTVQQDTVDVALVDRMLTQDVRQRLEAHLTACCSPAEIEVLRFFFVGMAPEEIATALHLKPATVRSHILRGRSKLLAHIILEDKDLIGGDEGIAQALEETKQDAETALTPEEEEAFAHPKGNKKAFYAACLKVARYLPLPVFLLLTLLHWRGHA
jgi:RNA polymerase sigma factor (sigma-70 family)